ncbi:shikimate kinase [Kaistella palustris]|uniref:shikimate kinase n=1 Tax=Kaistella palustris TaxID=493376 RepID=UPI0003F81A61|nr:shikimate kinase [Kaistella palustris]
MKISLIGYMGSGKSHVAKILSREMQIKLIDLDRQISSKNNLTIPEIFEKRGEIYFRKEERETLEEVLADPEDLILSPGGGTPAYFNNMELLNRHTESIFLRTSVMTLTERLLRNKDRRPLIAKIPPEGLPEFIAKHLFERNAFYAQAKFTVDTDRKTIDQIVAEIKKLF